LHPTARWNKNRDSQQLGHLRLLRVGEQVLANLEREGDIAAFIAARPLPDRVTPP
jgi:hypothetical protein